MARGRFHGAAVCAAHEHTARQRGAAAAPAATRLQAELPQKKQPRCLPDLAFSEQGRGQTVLAREPLAVPVPTVALSGSGWLLPQPASPLGPPACSHRAASPCTGLRPRPFPRLPLGGTFGALCILRSPMKPSELPRPGHCVQCTVPVCIPSRGSTEPQQCLQDYGTQWPCYVHQTVFYSPAALQRGSCCCPF